MLATPTDWLDGRLRGLGVDGKSLNHTSDTPWSNITHSCWFAVVLKTFVLNIHSSKLLVSEVPHGCFSGLFSARTRGRSNSCNPVCLFTNEYIQVLLHAIGFQKCAACINLPHIAGSFNCFVTSAQVVAKCGYHFLGTSSATGRFAVYKGLCTLAQRSAGSSLVAL